MASHLDSDAVEYLCDCGRPNRINKLFFCRHCLRLRCGRCACTQVDSFFCSSCLENIPSAEAKFAGNRCTKCYDCPCCQHTLTSRAAKPHATVPVLTADGAADESTTTATTTTKESPAAAAAASKRKVYYLMCLACSWTSRDVGIPDRPVATGQWPDLEYAHATRFASLLENCRNVVLHDKQEAQDWARRKANSQQKYASLTVSARIGGSIPFCVKSILFIETLRPRNPQDRTGLTVAMARRTLGWTDKAAPKRINQPAAIKPSVASAEVPALCADLLTRPLQLAAVTTLRQRLHLPAVQPHTVDGLHPAHKCLSIKWSVRCGQCEHYVIKPEFNPTSIKYRIHSLASGHVPVVRMMPPTSGARDADGLQLVRPGDQFAVHVKLINPMVYEMRVRLTAAPSSADQLAGRPGRSAAELVLSDDDGPAGGDGDGGGSDGLRFVVQRRDDSTEFDGDTALPDDPDFVLWRRSNAVVVEMVVRAAPAARSGDVLRLALRIEHNYVNAYPGSSSAAAGASSAAAAASVEPSSGVGAAEHALSSQVFLRVGRIQEQC